MSATRWARWRKTQTCRNSSCNRPLHYQKAYAADRQGSLPHDILRVPEWLELILPLVGCRRNDFYRSRRRWQSNGRVVHLAARPCSKAAYRCNERTDASPKSDRACPGKGHGAVKKSQRKSFRGVGTCPRARNPCTQPSQIHPRRCFLGFRACPFGHPGMTLRASDAFIRARINA